MLEVLELEGLELSSPTTRASACRIRPRRQGRVNTQ